jgi:hypothetical protein
MAGRRKRRVAQHMMEDASIQLVIDALPKEWVVRQYRPDYGLDLAVETFRQVDGNPGVFETMGEHFFVQVKSVKQVATKRTKVSARLNVAKFPLGETNPAAAEAEARFVDVIPFAIDTGLLNTVQAMGASALVYLFLASLEDSRVFFVCLNDYIDKILVPEQPGFSEQESVTLRIPASNELGQAEALAESYSLLRFFAKRAKFYSAFNLFAYQRHELRFLDDSQHFRQMAAHFLQIISGLDIWNSPGWAIVEDYAAWLSHLKEVLPNVPDAEWFARHPVSHVAASILESEEAREKMVCINISQFWDGLNVLSRNYEEICREWFLPTDLAEGLRRK